MSWKVIAIIFMTLFFLETAFFIWAYSLGIKIENETNECYYNICKDYPEALYQDNVCYCYDYDLMGELVVDKTEYMK